MEKGILNVDSLNVDIKKIEYYKSIENDTLKKILNLLIDASESYITANNNLILNYINDNNESISKILDKRNKYIKILNNVIKNYHTNSMTTKKIFGGLNE